MGIAEGFSRQGDTDLGWESLSEITACGGAMGCVVRVIGVRAKRAINVS